MDDLATEYERLLQAQYDMLRAGKKIGRDDNPEAKALADQMDEIYYRLSDEDCDRIYATSRRLWASLFPVFDCIEVSLQHAGREGFRRAYRREKKIIDAAEIIGR